MYSVILSPFPFSLTITMNFYAQELKLNLLPPEKLYCDLIIGALCLLKICPSFGKKVIVFL